MAILQLKLVCFSLQHLFQCMNMKRRNEARPKRARSKFSDLPRRHVSTKGDVRESWLALPSHEPDWVPAREHKLQVLCDRSLTTFDGCNDNLVKIYYYALHKSVVLPFVEHRWKIFIYGSIKIKKHGNDSSLYMHCVNEGGRRTDHRRGRDNIDLL